MFIYIYTYNGQEPCKENQLNLMSTLGLLNFA